MSASDKEPDGRKERYRRAVTFLDGARHLPELTQSQVDRIERHLNRARPRRARRSSMLMPALAALAVVLLAGAALAVTGTGLSRLPGIGRLLGAIFAPAPARSPAPGQPPRPVPDATRAPSVAQVQAQAPLPSAAAPEPPPAPRLAAARPALPATPALAPDRVVAAREGGSVDAPAPPRKRRAQATVALAGDEGAVPAAVSASAPAAASTMQVAPPASAPTAAAPPATPPGATATDPVAAPAAPASAPGAVLAPSAAAERPIVAESRSFAAALGRWHRDHDAGGALAALDAHERRFPNGEIRLEAQLLRAEILLAGGHEREGLALLDPLQLSGMPRARELRTVRGELRIKFERCLDGKSDLGAVLAERTTDHLAERARQALVHCP